MGEVTNLDVAVAEDDDIVVDTGVSDDGVATDVVISVGVGVDIDVDDDDDDICEGKKWYSSKLPLLPNILLLDDPPPAPTPPPDVILNPRLVLEIDFFPCVNLC